MKAFISALFGSVLADLLQLAAGCLCIVAANRMKAGGFSLRVDSPRKKMLTAVAAPLAGALIPLGAFGAIPVAAAALLSGLELPFVLPFLVSNLLFNLSLPLTQDTFAWNGSLLRMLTAAAAGMLCCAALVRSGGFAARLPRAGAYRLLVDEQAGERNYPRVLRRYFEAAGLWIFAAAAANAAFSLYIGDWLYMRILGTGPGMAVAEALSGLNILNPYFLPTLERLIDFSALAAMLLFLKTRSVLKLYLFYAAALLPLAATLWIR